MRLAALPLALTLLVASSASAQQPASSATQQTASGGNSTPVGGATSTPTSGATTGPAPATAAQDVPIQEEDDGRKADFVWLEVEGGFSYVNLIALREQNFSSHGTTVTGATFDEVEGSGPSIAAALGFRLFFLALGARATFAHYGAFDIGTVGGEIQLRLPVPVIEPWVRVGAGYAWQGNASYRDPLGESSTTVHGWTINAAVGMDVFLTWWLSIGVGATLDFLNMTRQADPTLPCMRPDEFCPMQDGDAIGLAARGFAQVGLHF